MDRRTAIALLGSAALALPSKSVFAQPLVSPDQADRASLYHDIWVSAISEASLRSEPSTNAERFAFVREGFPLKVLEYDDSWLYVLNPRTQGTAYISQSLVQPADTPSKFVTRDMPKLDDEFQDTLIASDDSTLFWYPSPEDDAVFGPLDASSSENIVGSIYGADGKLWYQTADQFFIPSDNMFLPSQPFEGRWLAATLLPSTRVLAMEGQQAVRTMYAIRGTSMFPTPRGVFSILRRVANETMDSVTVGIPHNSPYGYLVKNVLWTQYFTGDGASLHYNWWSSNFGGIGSHGCLGLSLSDSSWLWDWAHIGTPMTVA